jgi:ectoine hydroxylase-related dioxygenase (phytanoyl-CoA dioxygenase family)
MPTIWFRAEDCDLAELRALVEQPTDPAAYPLADSIERGVPVYDAVTLRKHDRHAVQAELIRALADGPGIVVFAGAFDPATVERASAAFTALVERQRESGAAAGDHFAKPGANDRVWNALEKLAVADPVVFADYYANDLLALVATAWLGPGYQVTSQLNVVNPGGAAQVPHRDYHLGFLGAARAAGYPAHVHRLSPALTLQGAVAHCDMPVETGPTLYLPYSQQYPAGYLVAERADFRAYFAERYVQLPLRQGDAVFFNPALLHGAGHNGSADVRRMANLLQISSAFGRAMESVDRERVSNALYPELLRRHRAGADPEQLRAVIAAAAEAYPFPTNLDRDPPLDGLAPASQADLVWQALREDREPVELAAALRAHAERRSTG